MAKKISTVKGAKKTIVHAKKKSKTTTASAAFTPEQIEQSDARNADRGPELPEFGPGHDRFMDEQRVIAEYHTKKDPLEQLAEAVGTGIHIESEEFIETHDLEALAPLPAADTSPAHKKDTSMDTITLVRKKLNKSKAYYTIPGIRFSSVRFSLSSFGVDGAPETLALAVDGADPFVERNATPAARGPVMTAEERAAARAEGRAKFAALSPADKLAVAKAKLLKQQDRIAKAEAKLGLVPAAV